jgi:hypothetical protein
MITATAKLTNAGTNAVYIWPPLRGVNCPIVQVAGEHSDDFASGMLPIGLAGAKRSAAAALRDIGPNFDQPAGAMHRNRYQWVTDPLDKLHGPFEP